MVNVRDDCDISDSHKKTAPRGTYIIPKYDVKDEYLT